MRSKINRSSFSIIVYLHCSLPNFLEKKAIFFILDYYNTQLSIRIICVYSEQIFTNIYNSGDSCQRPFT